jgi:hypothetical protein
VFVQTASLAWTSHEDWASSWPDGRAARDAATTLIASEQTELDALIEEEIRASVKRIAALLHDLWR